ncbi:MAG: 16S rRNA (cytidine(1402)-2'-O)-methyltransferase [Desulfobacteraceae bacterium]|nr:MAG: 16S rRNA (cytidine(1402)-2'-O)-methyltransferase [Desulfobacteraceae bacterium]
MDRIRATNESGTLYVVATPLGNLKDITLRALESLKNSDLIAAEDTRRTQKLLAAYDLHVPLTSYHEHNKQAKSRGLMERLLRGEKVALVTDGGTPGISDPGQELVRQARESGIPVVPIPGPSAVTCALSVSGMEGGAFVFLGFLPRRRSRRRRILEETAAQGRTVVLYESPYRIKKLLTEIRDLLGDHDIFLTRELTKLHEELLSGTVSQVLQSLGDKEVLGEITLVLAPSEGKIP